MAVLMTMEFPGAPEQYDAVTEKLDPEGAWPEGLLVHAAEQTEGRMRVVDVWESQQAFEAFRDQRLGPALGEVLGEEALGSPPELEFRELYNVMRP